jgi:hypothetical protein
MHNLVKHNMRLKGIRDGTIYGVSFTENIPMGKFQPSYQQVTSHLLDGPLAAEIELQKNGITLITSEWCKTVGKHVLLTF